MSQSSFAFMPNLLDAIQLPENGTLSVPVHQDATTKVLLFAFSAGQELSEHMASVPATMHLLMGRVVWGFSGEEREAGPGAWAHMDANLPHSVRALEPAVMLLTLNQACRGG
jgi:quercetin dioxygenase-like cupin family protein